MPTPKGLYDLTDSIDEMVTTYAADITPIQEQLYKRISVLLKDLTLDTDGNIKTTVANYKIITQVKNIVNKELSSDAYIDQVSKVNENLKDIQKIQTDYFNKMFTDFETPTVMREIQKQSLDETVGSLTESGVNEAVSNEVVSIVSDNIKSGRNYVDMQGELEKFILGDEKIPGRLQSYSKQILNDSLSQYAGHYTNTVTDDLNLQWYQYVGSLVRDSRPLCKALVEKRYIHQSELKGICRGHIDGQKVSTQGMISGTDDNNFIVNRGGYNCGHQLVPVSEEFVPKDLVAKFKDKK